MNVQSGPEASLSSTVDRRKYPRYRYMASVQIRTIHGTLRPGMSLEISEGGISVATDETLRMGETVELDPVLDAKTSAVVRHKQGRIYGFEFMGLATEHRDRIRARCAGLPRFNPRHMNI